MNELSSSKHNPVIWVGHAFFLVFIAMAAIFFREREFLADNAFHIFTILRTGTFAIFQERYSIVLNQLLPVLGVKLGLPLNTILVLHAVSVPLFLYGCFLLAAHALKNYRTALAIVLGACILVTQSFYFLFEMHQAISLLLLLHGFILIRQTFRVYHWILLLAGLILAFFLHPLVLIGFVYLSGYTMLQEGPKNLWRKNKRLILIILAGLVIVAVRAVYFSNPYEQEKTPGLGSLHLMLKIHHFEVTPYFLKWLFKDYYLLLLFSAIITVHYLRGKKWLRLGWYWASVTGFILLVLSVQKNGNESIRYYLELHYQLFALMAVVPLVYEVWPRWENKRLIWGVLVLLLLSRFATFYAYRTIFTDRLNWYDKIYDYTTQFPETKFIINEENVPGLKAQNQLLWATANESLLYFASTGREQDKTIFVAGNSSQFNYLATEPGVFASTFEAFAAETLPTRYFNLKPSPYRFLNTIAPDSAIQETVTIRPVQNQLSAKPGKVVQVPVQIRSEILLSSGLSSAQSIMLGYRLYKNGLEIAAHTIKTPLEVDVSGTYEQMLLVEAPEKAGIYQLMPVLLPQDMNTWKPEQRMKLIVE